MIDLHTHTRHSDGADDPVFLLEAAQELSLRYLSITDHNTVAAYRTPALAGQLGHSYQGTLIRGVEITCMYCGEVVEVLGYGFDLDAMEAELHRHVLTFEQKQLREYELICSAFRAAEVRFDPEKICFDPKTESSRKAFLTQLREDTGNRRFFSHETSWGNSRHFTRDEVYNPESPLYVDQSPLYPDLQTAVDMIHRSGGLAFWAHLYIYSHAADFRARLASIAGEFRLDGMECSHSAFTPEQVRDLEMFCAEHRLLRSGGSDYHGSRKPDAALGFGGGGLRVPEEYLAGWPHL